MNPDDSRRQSGREEDPTMIGTELRDVEDRLRSALRGEAGSIRPHERLGAILSAANAAPRGGAGTPHRWLVLAAAAAVALVAAGTVWLAGRPTALAPAPAGSTTSSATGQPTSTPTNGPTSPIPSATSGTDPATLPSQPPAATTNGPHAPSGSINAVPVYWIGQTAGAPRLFREFRTVPDEGGPVLSALYAMTRMQPLDPDYSTPWLPASRVNVERSGSNLVVSVSADAVASTGVGSQLAERAVQQLVYTATAAASMAHTPVTTVTILVDGAPADLWGSVRVGRPMSRAPMIEVQSHIWALTPQEGDEVGAGPVTFKGYGTSFEANFRWRITTQSGSLVAEGNAMGGTGSGGFGELEFSRTLPAGDYVVEMATDDPSGGEGGGPQVDTKSFTVR